MLFGTTGGSHRRRGYRERQNVQGEHAGFKVLWRAGTRLDSSTVIKRRITPWQGGRCTAKGDVEEDAMTSNASRPTSHGIPQAPESWV